MKILLIQPSRFRSDGRLERKKRRWLLGMTLPYVAALAPREARVQIKDDLLEDITFQEDCDLVGLSFMSHQASRAYQIAAGFRARGVPVVLGGFHATLAPEEAREHADALVLGEAEEAWPRLLKDFQAGKLQPLYQAERLSDLKALPVPRYDLLDLKRYKLLNIPSQTTRGCPWPATTARSPRSTVAASATAPWTRCSMKSRKSGASPAARSSTSWTTTLWPTASMPWPSWSASSP